MKPETPEIPNFRSVTGGYFNVSFFENGDMGIKCKRCNVTQFFTPTQSRLCYSFLNNHYVRCPDDNK